MDFLSFDDNHHAIQAPLQPAQQTSVKDEASDNARVVELETQLHILTQKYAELVEENKKACSETFPRLPSPALAVPVVPPRRGLSLQILAC